MKRALGALAVAGLAMLLYAGWLWQQGQQRERGVALFRGERPVVARLQGHAQPLPALAVRCSNCHEVSNTAPAGSAAAGSAAAAPGPYAGLLTGTALTTLRSRRGGPPSAYDAERLCALLRTGIDPVQVMIPNTMPRYDVSPNDCADLWAYLRHDKP